MKKFSMFAAGLCVGAIYLSIKNNMPKWWTVWLFICLLGNLYFGTRREK